MTSVEAIREKQARALISDTRKIDKRVVIKSFESVHAAPKWIAEGG